MSESIQEQLRGVPPYSDGIVWHFGSGPDTIPKKAADYIDRLEEALRFYADQENWEPHFNGLDRIVLDDQGQRARKALEK